MTAPETEGRQRVLTVGRDGAGKRVDSYAAQQIKEYSRSQIARLIKEGHLTVDGRPVKANHKLKAGETIEVIITPPTTTTVEPEDIPLDIIFEDNDLIVINKPPGMVTHPGAGNPTGTLVNALLFHCQTLSPTGGPERAGIVHRLDKGTSGLLVVAKNEVAHSHLANQLQDKTLFREYLAFCWGHLKEPAGSWDLPIGRSVSNPTRMRIDHGAGREALTEYKVIERYELGDKLQLRLKTGRTHQIRVHLAHHNHPVFGDPDYAGREQQIKGIAPELRPTAKKLLKLIDRPALHSARLGFVHPTSGKPREFSVDPPEDMQQLEKALVSSTDNREQSPHSYPPDIAYNYYRE
ncbi:MAG: RluA family pseudouridine synthase [Planctomycetota bacterium]|nr:MAG: RluA family pseudouridine synthase [Planctomycetota bacterium]